MSCDCKKCKRTRKVLDNEDLGGKQLRWAWEGVDFEDIYFTDENIFIQLNDFPTIDELKCDVDKYKLKNLYNKIHYEHFDDLLCDSTRMRYYEEFRGTMIYILTIRGCQFYPQIFDEDFQNIALTTIFK